MRSRVTYYVQRAWSLSSIQSHLQSNTSPLLFVHYHRAPTHCPSMALCRDIGDCRILRAKRGTLKATISAKFSANAMIKITSPWSSELLRNNAYTWARSDPLNWFIDNKMVVVAWPCKEKPGGKCKGHRRHDAPRRMATSLTFARFSPERWS